MSSSSKRRVMDLVKLMMHDFKVETINDRLQQVYVHFNGPPNSIYAGGVWKVKVGLPNSYPYSYPSIDFVTKIYHPNIDEKSGAVCLDVISESWNPMFDLVNVFELFLPQLLMDPNPADPLNSEAARLLLADEWSYAERVKEYCERYAKPEDMGADEDKKPSEDEKEDSADATMAGGSVDP